jgi:hypothetical protein
MTRDSRTARSPWRSTGTLLWVVDGVVRDAEQQLALVLQVFQDDLEGNSLEAQGRLRTVRERAAEGADELHRRRHL